jgi:hypothetical protein
MKNITAAIGVLNIIKRLTSSRNGNPRYLLTVDGWTCATQPDSGYAYMIDSLDGKFVNATIGSHYGVLTLNSIQSSSKGRKAPSTTK